VKVTDSGSHTATSGSIALVVQPTGTDDATGVQSVPTTVSPGQVFTATVTMTNTGTSTWISEAIDPTYAYRLGSQNPQDNSVWGPARSTMPLSQVTHSGSVTFTFQCTAPTTPGTYPFSWRMLHEGYQWFGATTNTSVTVGTPAVTVSVSPATASLTTGQTQTFAASVSGTTNTAVTWSISPSVGTISSSGLYTAPNPVSSSQVVTVRATSVAAPSSSGTAQVSLAPPPPPTIGAVTPGSGAGMSGTVTFTVSDVAGATNIKEVQPYFSITANPVTITNACHMDYVRASNTLFLDGNAGTYNWVGASAIGANGSVLANSQCAVDTAQSSVTAVGNMLTINLAMTFLQGFAGKAIYDSVSATDNQGNVTPWVYEAWWSVPASLPLQLGPISPVGLPTAHGVSQNFVFTVLDGAGYSKVDHIQGFFSSTFPLATATSCHFWYNNVTNQLSVDNDNATGVYTTGLLGGSGTLSNDYCKVNLPTSSASKSGSTINLTLDMTFLGSFLNKTLYVYDSATDVSNNTKGWAYFGTWKVQ